MKLERLYEPYSVRRSCERCCTVDYVARLGVPFSRPVHLCRRCRQVITGVPDTRNMPSTMQATATIAEPEPLEAPVRIAGLLTAGHASDPEAQP